MDRQGLRDALLKDPARRKKLAFVLGFAAFIVAVGFYVSDVLTPVLLGLAVAYILAPVVNWLEKLKIRRALAVSLLYLALLLAFVIGMVLSIPLIYRQFSQAGRLFTAVGEHAGGVIEKLTPEAEADPEAEPPAEQKGPPAEGTDADPRPETEDPDKTETIVTTTPEDVEAKPAPKKQPAPWQQRVSRLWQLLPAELRKEAGQVSQTSLKMLGWLANNVLTGIGSVISFLFVISFTLVYSFFFLLGFERMKQGVAKRIPTQFRRTALRIFRNIDRSIASFFRGRLIICIITGVLTSLGLLLCGVRLWLLLGMATGFLAIIPFLGVVITFIPCALLAYFDNGHSLVHAAGVLGVFVFGQIIENLVLNPVLLAKEVDLHPVAVMIALTVGGKLLGIFGVLLSIPLACTVKILYMELVEPTVTELATEPSAIFRLDSEPPPEAGIPKSFDPPKNKPNKGGKA